MTHIAICCAMLILFLTDALFTTVGRRLNKIRKRKQYAFDNNQVVEPEQHDDFVMYYTRRTTPWPRMQVTVDPHIEAYYNKKIKKDCLIKQRYFKKAKKKEKERKHIKPTFGDMYKAPALD